MNPTETMKQDKAFMSFYKELSETFGKPSGFKIESMKEANKRWDSYNVNIYEDTE